MAICLSALTEDNVEKKDVSLSIWWWEPLWFYVCDNCKDIITTEEIKNGYLKPAVALEKILINKDMAIKIAQKLETLSSEGKVGEYEKIYSKDIYKYGSKLKWLARRLSDDEQDDLVDCVAAVLPYKFSEKLVAKFIKFAKESGGFEIY